MKLKKLIAVFCIFGFCSLGFSRVFIQQDLKTVGAYVDFDYDCFNEVDPSYLSASFTTLGGFAGLIGWEFKTDNLDLPVHFFAGCDVGLAMYGITTCPVAGINYSLYDFGKVRLELSGTLGLGPCFGAFGGVYPFGEMSVDVLLIKHNRRGPYGGIGFTSINYPDFCIFKGYGINMNNDSYVGGRVFVGWKI